MLKPQFLKRCVQLFPDLHTLFHGKALALQSRLPWQSNGVITGAHWRRMACFKQPAGLGIESACAAE
jgi:hypothetical protein